VTQSVHSRVSNCLENEAVKSRYILFSLGNSLISKATMDARLRQRTSHFNEGEVADDDEYLDEDDSEGMAKTMTLRYHLLKAFVEKQR